MNNEKPAQIVLTFANNALVEASFLPVTFKEVKGSIPESEYVDISIYPLAVSKILDNDGEFAPVYNITEDISVLPLWAEQTKGGNK